MAWINLLETIYPVGSVYISTLQISPSSTIGGTWTQVTDAVLRGSNSTGYTGSDTHTLSVDEMPSHSHQTPMCWIDSGNMTISSARWVYRDSGTTTAQPTWNTYATGGGRSIQSCNALTTSLSGTEQHRHIKPSFGGDMIWRG